MARIIGISINSSQLFFMVFLRELDCSFANGLGFSYFGNGNVDVLDAAIFPRWCMEAVGIIPFYVVINAFLHEDAIEEYKQGFLQEHGCGEKLIGAAVREMAYVFHGVVVHDISPINYFNSRK